MNCDKSMELIGLHIDGESTPEQEQQLSEHLAGCASCRALLEAYEQIDIGVAALEAEPPERFVSGVMYRVSQESGGTKKRRFVHRHAAALVGVAAALAVLVGTGTLPLPRAEDAIEYETVDVADAQLAKTAAPAAADSAETVEAEQPEADVGQMALESYDAVFDAVADTDASAAEDASMKLESEMADAFEDTVAEDVSEAAASVLRATLRGCSEEDIPELATLTPAEGEPGVYYGTLAQVREILERYRTQYAVECDDDADAPDDMLVALTILPE